MDSLGLYISVPFCKAKCTFCNFASGAFGLERVEGYVDRLCREIEAVRVRSAALGVELPEVADSVYFGGGTPSLLTAAQLQKMFAALRGEFDIAENAEMTLECAPGQMSEETLAEAQRQGTNRISFGVQSFVDRETAAVGRLHTAKDCMAEIARMRSAGLHEISVDLIAGLPGQSAASWEVSLNAVVDAELPHASVYMLEVDEDSRLGKELTTGGPRYGASIVPSDEAMTEFYARAVDVFEAAGLRQYEISNFARDGHASAHNLKYWRRQPYLGFGLDAHSMLPRDGGAVRFANADGLDEYMQGERSEMTEVNADAAFEEALFLGLRMNAGVDVAQLESEFGRARVRACAGSIAGLIKGEMLARRNDRIMLTQRGRMVSNDVFGELLSAVAV